MSDQQRAIQRDVFSLKGDLDDVLYAFAERLSKEPLHPIPMARLDELVDEASKEMVIPVAGYVKRTARRHGCNLGEPPAEE